MQSAIFQPSNFVKIIADDFAHVLPEILFLELVIDVQHYDG